MNSSKLGLLLSPLRLSHVYPSVRYLSVTPVCSDKHSCRLLVVGGGAGGCTMAAKFAKSLGKDRVIVLDPASVHYYQPMFTLVGGGVKSLSDTRKQMSSVLPKDAKWLQDEVATFEPEQNQIRTKKGDKIKYDFMVVAVGIQLNYDKIPGLLEGLSIPDSGVCSNYSPDYVDRTFQAIKKFKKGNAIFTFPNTPVKCAGAPQKILYLAEDYFRKHKKRDNATVIYNTSLPVIFGVKHYADALWKIVKGRNIVVNTRQNLIEIRPKERQAVFENLDKPEEKTQYDYSLLHVTPPQSSPDCLRLTKATGFVDSAGFLDVDKHTLRHTTYKNVYGIGDCTNLPTSKTGAAVAGQSGVVARNLRAAMAGSSAQDGRYDGYTSCPLLTRYGRCVMAEFDYNQEPLETLPISQDKELRLSWFMKVYILPEIYWRMMLNGYWNGPKVLRKILHLGMK